ncbi:hypothetical protein EDWATA_04056 [Edwardsiella tarda ATCC 23685]|uniref:Uncharacterized protein n=1 Tax=Edwardsiella tarda ATCC 23685 TaxID=500638 RepID=D4FB85_EDWTA|nr:hypothetical protein EDWATA_04056 [Edwardsiella tarda ATCC 23685]
MHVGHHQHHRTGVARGDLGALQGAGRAAELAQLANIAGTGRQWVAFWQGKSILFRHRALADLVYVVSRAGERYGCQRR